MGMDKRCTEPRDIIEFKSLREAQFARAYHERLMSEAVYRASLYALGLRGTAIETQVRINAPPVPVPPVEKYYIKDGKVYETVIS